MRIIFFLLAHNLPSSPSPIILQGRVQIFSSSPYLQIMPFWSYRKYGKAIYILIAAPLITQMET